MIAIALIWIRANPFLARFLAVVILIAMLCGVIAAHDHNVDQAGYARAEAFYKERERTANDQTTVKLGVLNERIRQLTATIADQLNTIAQMGEKGKQDAQAHKDHLRDDVRTGAVVLRVPVAATNCKAADAGQNHNPAAGGRPDAASADILPATADDLVSLAFDADAEVRRTNQCIASYNAVKTALDAMP